MTTSISNFQSSLSILQYVPLAGVFPSRDTEPGGSYAIPLGSIRSFAGNFAPGGALEANGQLLLIQHNTALFSLLGTNYGGDGRTTYALPNLDDRTVIGSGQGSGLSGVFDVGSVVGTPAFTLTQPQLPSQLGGASIAIDNYQPSLAITNIIRVAGIFPSQNSGGAGFIGEVVKFAGNFAPQNYLEAAGQLLSISEYDALFTIIGTTYGGDGIETFALPDLRGHNAVGATGSDPVGTVIGTEANVLTNGEIPTNVGGSGGTIDNREPGVALSYLIALQGVFPPRDGGGDAPEDQPYLGEITLFAGNFAPRGWALCEGQILQINQNQALFSLLGTMYGGDGRTTFALPDFRGRTAIGSDGDTPVGTVLGIDDPAITSANIPDIDISGTLAGETMFGGDGNDTLHAINANHLMIGNAGNDTYYIDGSGDRVDESVAGSAGEDTVHSSNLSINLNYASVFKGGVENATLDGSYSLNITGNGLDNKLTGNSGVNVIEGGAGNDMLDGKAGGDTMRGFTGNDTYYVDSSADIVDESVAGSSGSDTVRSSNLSINLGFSSVFQGNIESAVLAGGSSLNLTGSAISNYLQGNNGNNILNGGGASDTLVGLGGNDIFRFANSLGATNIDTITDYNPAQDRIELDNAYFSALPDGWLYASAFTANTTGIATDASDRIIYETDTGKLFYDSNGSASGGTYQQFATLSAGLTMSAGEFFVT